MKFLVLAGVLYLSACGYQLEGKGVFMPKHLQKIAVPIFENQSFDQEISVAVTQEILSELNRRGGLELVDDPALADGILRGTIESYKLSVLSTDSGGRASSYRVFISSKIIFEDKVQKKIYWQNTLSKTRDFSVEDDAAATDVQEQEAIQKAAEDFAKTAVNAIFLGF